MNEGAPQIENAAEKTKAEVLEKLNFLKGELSFAIQNLERGEDALNQLSLEELEKAETYLGKAFLSEDGKYADIGKKINAATSNLSSLEGDLFVHSGKRLN
jgi:hypothetical protein